MMLNKKGQVQSLAPAILALVFAAIVLVFGLVMTQELTDTQDATAATTAANESITAWVNGVNQSLDGAATCGFGTITEASVVVYNTTNDVLVTTGNYSVNSAGQMINLTADISMYPWQVSYPYTWGDEACVAGEATTTGLGTFADFWEIIVLAIVITIVIGLLLVVFGGRSRR